MYKLITYLEFSQSETTSSTNFGVVSLWLTANNWTQWASCGSWEQILRLLDTILASTEFASWLIEPGPDESLPPLMVVGIWYHIITLHHLDKVFSTANKKKSRTISKKNIKEITSVIQNASIREMSNRNSIATFENIVFFIVFTWILVWISLVTIVTTFDYRIWCIFTLRNYENHWKNMEKLILTCRCWQNFSKKKETSILSVRTL